MVHMRLNIPTVLVEDKILELPVHVSTLMVETTCTTHSRKSKQKKKHVKWTSNMADSNSMYMFIKSMDKYVTTIIISFIKGTLSRDFALFWSKLHNLLSKYLCSNMNHSPTTAKDNS